jgi:tRNA-specific 2-thiouridylase
VHHFTVGQRKGLGVSRGEPLYVLGVDAEQRAVRVGRAADLAAGGLVARDVNWLGDGPPRGPRAVSARIRYRHAGADATVVADDGGAVLRFHDPVRAVTPGQAVVFYDGAEVLGGGWIERALPIDSGPSAGSSSAP